MEQIAVEVVYALTDAVDAVRLSLPAPATAEQAVRASGILERHPQLAGARLRIGIHGKSAAPATALQDGDRVEIYRSLLLDPKEARRQRARGRRGR